VATPFVQGRLRSEPLTFEINSECACCGRPIQFRMDHELRYALAEPDSDPMVFAPLVDFTKLRAPSIVNAF
jgi:hypothetical protein